MRLRWFLRAACCVNQAVRGAECCNVLCLFPFLVGGRAGRGVRQRGVDGRTLECRVAAAAFGAAGGSVVCGVFLGLARVRAARLGWRRCAVHLYMSHSQRGYW